MKLDKEIEPVPADSTLLVRPRSAIGLKYIELTPGSGRAGFKPGAVVPIRQARAGVVELDDVLNMFDDKTRVGSRNSLNGYGGGLAGRGEDINTAIEALRPLLTNLEPVARNLAAPETRLDRLFRALGDAAGEVAPVAEEQASLFVNLDTSFTALASIARPFLQDTITEARARRRSRSATSPASARSSATTRPCSASCVRAWQPCRARPRSSPTPSRPGPRRCRRQCR